MLVPDNQQQPPPFQANPDDQYATKLKEFITRKAPYEHPLHLRKHAKNRKADLHFMSIQWLRPSFNLDPHRTPHWSQRENDPNDTDAIPMPVYNEMAAHIQNEAARLGRPEYKPYVRPSGKTPNAKTKEAARRATEILEAQLELMGWDEIAEQGYHHMPMYGGWWLKSRWDTSMDDTVRVPVDGAQKCTEPGCDFKLASSELSDEHAQKAEQAVPGSVQSEEIPDEKNPSKIRHTVSTCLQCEDHTATGPTLDETGQPVVGADGGYIMAPQKVPGAPKLEPFTPVDEELTDTDYFDRPLGKDMPRGKWVVSIPSPYDVFPQDLGVDQKVNAFGEIVEIHVESLDWIRARWPDKAAKVKAENQQALLQWHPVCGERAVFSYSAIGGGIFKNHSRVKEYHKGPWLEQDSKTGRFAMNKGRSIVMAGDVLLMDGPLMMESRNEPGKFVERVKYDYVYWEPRSGGRELEGIGLAEMMFDAQENINEGKSQTQDCRKRMASPKWLVARAMNLDYSEAGEAGSHWFYDPIPVEGLQGLTPKEVGSTTISPGVAEELNRDLEYMDRVSGKSAVEDGNVPPGVSAAAAIQMLAEQTSERRAPRIRRIRKMFMRIWRHGLELNHEFVVEEREYAAKNDADEWCDRSWIGTDIAGQFDVRIDPEPEHDTVIQKQERIRDAVTNLKLVDTSNPKVAMEIARELDMPTELFEDQNLQDEAAERELIDFLELGRPPVIDADLDDPAAHYDRHGRDCHGEKWRALERQAKWDEALTYLYGWDKPTIPIPQPAPPTMPGMMPMPPPPPIMASAFDVFEMQQNQAQQQPPMPGMPPPPPPLPPLPELHVEACWHAILEQNGYMQKTYRAPEELEALGKVLRFRAHLTQHKRDEQEQTAVAQAGQAVVAAPEAAATQAGTVPTPGNGAPPAGQQMPEMAGQGMPS